jgi:hypothetical protein
MNSLFQKSTSHFTTINISAESAQPEMKIYKICMQSDSNVVIDLILVTQKATSQFTDTLGGTVIPIIEDL